MNISETRNKLEFEKIIEALKKQCRSPLGQNLCNNIDFFRDSDILEKELNKVSQMKFIVDTEGILDFTNLFDVKEAIEKLRISGSFLSPEKLLWILNFLRISRKIKSFVKSINKGDINQISCLVNELYSDRIIENRIESSIDDEGNVKDSASLELKKIRGKIIELHNTLRKSLLRILYNLSEQDYSREEIITLRDGRSVIPVKVENKRKVKGIIHSTSASGATVFIEPADTTELNNDIIELQFREQREIDKILTQLTSNLLDKYQELKNNYSILSELDFLQAKSLLANKMNAVQPAINQGPFKIYRAYHPLLLTRNGEKNVVPNNFEINDNINTVIITGPNAGGKTVALKTLGLMQMMLQSAFLVPVNKDSSFNLFDKIFVNIGDDQSLDNDLSSFSSHLKVLNEIIEMADESTLVLIDEICSGTDPRFGSSLAASVLKYLSDKNSITFVTTHIGDLKSYALKEEKFLNASMEFDSLLLIPTFKYVMGIPGQSFTFEIASRYLKQPEIISMAENILNSDQYNLELVIRDLTKTKEDYTKLKENYDIGYSRLNGILKLYTEKMEKLEKMEKAIITHAKDEAAKIINEGNKLIEKTIKEVQENKKIKYGHVKNTFKSEAEKLINNTKENINNINCDFKINDIVKLKDSTSYGRILDIKGNNVILLLNGMTVKSGINEIIKVGNGDNLNETKAYGYKIELNGRINNKLDLRGSFTDEIKVVLEDFIYEGHINSLNELIIIHGKGEGKLRREVHRQLKNSSYVNSFRLGNWNEGDAGVTIVELK